MKYCKVENGIPKPGEKYPDRVHNPELYSDADMEKIGFFPYKQPECDWETHDIDKDSFYFDAENKIVSWKLKQHFQTVEEAKTYKIGRVKKMANRILRDTDWYITRLVETDVPVPAEVLSQRATIRTRCNEMEGEVNALTDYTAIMKYNISF